MRKASKKNVVPMDIWISNEARAQIAKGLSSLLADSYTLFRHFWKLTVGLAHRCH